MLAQEWGFLFVGSNVAPRDLSLVVIGHRTPHTTFVVAPCCMCNRTHQLVDQRLLGLACSATVSRSFVETHSDVPNEPQLESLPYYTYRNRCSVDEIGLAQPCLIIKKDLSHTNVGHDIQRPFRRQTNLLGEANLPESSPICAIESVSWCRVQRPKWRE